MTLLLHVYRLADNTIRRLKPEVLFQLHKTNRILSPDNYTTESRGGNVDRNVLFPKMSQIPRYIPLCNVSFTFKGFIANIYANIFQYKNYQKDSILFHHSESRFSLNSKPCIDIHLAQLS
jgi:hypothetical protein